MTNVTSRDEPVGPRGEPAGANFVAVSRFVVANGKDDEVEAAFRARPHAVDDAPGFLRMEVLRDLDDPREFWLVTHWDDEPSFRSWHQGHTFHAAHRGIPAGLKLERGAQWLRRMSRISR